MPEPEDVREPSVGGVGASAAGVLAATAGSLTMWFLTFVVIARALGPDGRGVVAVLQTTAVVLVAVLGLGVPWALYYFAGRAREPQPALLGISVVHAAGLAVVGAALAVALGGAYARAQDLPEDVALYLLTAALVPLTFLEIAHVDMLRAQRRQRLANTIVVAGRAVGLAVAVVLLVGLDRGVNAAVVALLAASAAQVLAALPTLARNGIALSRELARRVRRYGVRVQGATVSRLLARRFDVLVLSLFVSPAVVGHYAVAQSLAELTLLVPQALGLALSPLIIGREAGRPITHRLIRLNGTVGLAFAAGLAATAPWTVVLAFGDAFEAAVVPLVILIPGAWMFACGDLVSHVLAARERPGTASLLSAMQAGLTIALDLVLIPAYGIEGAAIASTLSYSAYGLASLVVLGRQDGVSPSLLLIVGPAELRAGLGTLRGRLGRGDARA